MNSTRNILVLTFWSYKEGLIHSYVLPYLRLINKHLQDHQKIYLVTLEKEGYECSEEEKIEIHKYLNGLNIVWVYKPYCRFGLCAIISWTLLIPKLALFSVRNKISHIHSWCTPAGAIGYLLSVMTGKKLIVDSFEPHAESMVENGLWKSDSIAFKLLFYLEKKQCKHANHLICTTSGMKDYMRKKYGVEDRLFLVKPACVDLDKFSLDKKKDEKLLGSLGLQNKIVCVYSGKIGGFYLEEDIFLLFKASYEHWGTNFQGLILTNHSRKEIDDYCDKVGIPHDIIISKFVHYEEIPIWLGLADFALSPYKPLPSKKYCTPVKNGEYWAMGLPVIITNDISDDTDIIAEAQIGSILKSVDYEHIQKAITEIDRLLDSKVNLSSEIRAVAEKFRSFKIAERVYGNVYAN